jgi:thioredoxin reductase (NADPH)
VLLAVDDDKDQLARVAEELRRRYGSDYRVICESSSEAALSTLEAMQAAGDDVAVVLADQWMDGLTGSELMARTRVLHPRAKRALLIEWGAWGHRRTAEAILRAMALGHIDYYVLKPWRTPDEFFHRTITEFIHEWSRHGTFVRQEVEVVAPRWSPRGHEIRSLLARNGVPHVFHDSDSDRGRSLLEMAHEADPDLPLDTDLPVVFLLDQDVLVDPSNTELAKAYGVSTELEAWRDFDVVVVGAGPAGLAASVYASSEGLRTLAIERESIGGQAGSSSLIRNYLGFSRGVSGAELAQRAYQQAWVFGTNFVLMQGATALRTEGARHVVTMADGSEATARAVILATGVEYRRLGIPALDELTGAGVFYGASVSEAQALHGQDAYIVGGGNSAGQAAMHLCRYARDVYLVVRGSSLADSMSQYLRELIERTDNIHVLCGTEVVDGGGAGRLEHLVLRDKRSGTTEEVPAAALFVLIGARPNTDWLPEEIERNPGGYVMTGPDAIAAKRERGYPEPTHPFKPLETCVPGVFAVGDLRHNAVKRVASAVGEGSIVVRQVFEYLARQEEQETAAAEPHAAPSG